jgi:sterol 3beta-glucosyltransferase
MRITIFGAGSQGDIQPCLRLGTGLKKAGFDILVAAPQNFSDQVHGYALEFQPVRGDVQQIMASETGRDFMERGGGNPIRSILAMRKMLKPIALQMAEDVLEACRSADALITLAVFAPLGKTVAELCNVPLILVEPTPMLPTGQFPAPGWPIQNDLGRHLNRFSGFGMLNIIWQWYRPFVNEFRKRQNLQTLTSRDFHRILTSVPLLGAYSSSVIKRPMDWPKNVHITGYWFQDNLHGWRPSVELDTFLSAGEKPVYVGFGSMAGRDPKRIAEIVLEALAKAGRRGVLATGWGGMDLQHIPKDVFVLDAAPHDWLFPRMSVVVHHGGAGTTAEGLRAGVPSVIVPFIVDQLFWGKRVQELGAGSEPIHAKRLTAANLTEAIQKSSSDAGIRSRAEAIGRLIRSEDGVGNAVQIIQNYSGARE